MKQLLIMRHAKSDRSNPALDDHERPLNPRGRAAAPVMGEWLKGRAHLPDEVLVSSSARTLETFDRLRRALPDLPRPRIETLLYLADANALLARLRSLPETCQCVLVIGHEPGLGDLIRMLAAPGVPEHCRAAFSHFPTAAVAVLETGSAWAALEPSGARFMDFAVPRDLADD